MVVPYGACVAEGRKQQWELLNMRPTGTCQITGGMPWDRILSFPGILVRPPDNRHKITDKESLL